MINPRQESILDCARVAYLRHIGVVENDEITIMNPVTRHTFKLNVYSDEGMFHVRRRIS